MRTIYPICIAALTLLAACSTPEQRAAAHLNAVEQMMQEYGPACDKMGFTRNTDPWRNCILQMSNQDDMTRYNAYYYGSYGPRWYW